MSLAHPARPVASRPAVVCYRACVTPASLVERARARAVPRYAVAVAAWAAALGVRESLDAAFHSKPFFTPFYPAILLAAWFGGWGPGTLAVGLSLGAGSWLWMESGAGPAGPERWLYVAGAAASMVTVVAVVELLHRARHRAETSERIAAREAERVARAVAARDAFLAMLGHELRNPLGAIRSAADLLLDSGDRVDRARLAAKVIDRQATHMTRLVNDLVDAGRVTSGKLPLRFAPCEARAVAEAALDMARPAIDAAGHTLECAWPDHPVTLHADADRLTQALANLLHNAAKYTPAGGHVRFDIDPGGPRVRFVVRDTGVGIPAGELDAIFEPFRQISPMLDRANGGLGLGLTVVKHTIEGHGGRIVAASDGMGRGSEFTIEIPRSGTAT